MSTPCCINVFQHNYLPILDKEEVGKDLGRNGIKDTKEMGSNIF